MRVAYRVISDNDRSHMANAPRFRRIRRGRWRAFTVPGRIDCVQGVRIVSPPWQCRRCRLFQAWRTCTDNSPSGKCLLYSRNGSYLWYRARVRITFFIFLIILMATVVKLYFKGIAMGLITRSHLPIIYCYCTNKINRILYTQSKNFNFILKL